MGVVRLLADGRCSPSVCPALRAYWLELLLPCVCIQLSVLDVAAFVARDPDACGADGEPVKVHNAMRKTAESWHMLLLDPHAKYAQGTVHTEGQGCKTRDARLEMHIRRCITRDTKLEMQSWRWNASAASRTLSPSKAPQDLASKRTLPALGSGSEHRHTPENEHPQPLEMNFISS